MKSLTLAFSLLFVSTVHASTADEQLLQFVVDQPAVVEVAPRAAGGTVGVFNIGPRMKRYSARVQNCGNNLKEVKIVVGAQPLEVQGLGLRYNDGGHATFDLTKTFPAGYQSSWFPLSFFNTGTRCITSVYGNARSGTPQGSTRVQVYGR